MVYRTRWVLATQLGLALCLNVPVIAQPTPDAPTDPDPTDVSTSAGDLRISPRFGVGANSSFSGGVDAFTRFDTFLPFFQTPGKQVAFFEGHFLVDTDVNPSGNMVLGYRHYHEKLNRTFGGYIGADLRTTENASFEQLGIGFESRGDVWDVLLNGYLPIGNSREQVAENIFDTGVQQVGPLRFQAHSLLVDTRRERTTTRQFEAALGGFDAQFGVRLARFDEGDLRFYAGPYLLSGKGIKDNLGARFRLVATPSRFANFGLGVQHDDVFGTNVLASVSLAFPGFRSKGPIPPEQRVAARMGDPVERNNTIIVDSQIETDVQVEEQAVAAINPATGEPWFFNHVNLGLGSSDGTFENPFGTVAEALATVPTDGNGIVYVAQGTNPGIPAFTIPDNVQVLSRGPIQQIDIDPIQSSLQPSSILALGTVQLPFSGDGNFPEITDTVTMGNNTLISGFDVQVTGAPALVANNITNATVRDNSLTSINSPTNGIAADGILVQNSNDVTLQNNTISSSTQDGIRLLNPTGTIVINNNQITNSGSRGIHVEDFADTGQVNLIISNNQISNTTDDGIFFDDINGTDTVTVTVANNTLNSIGAAGIEFGLIAGDATANITVANNQITDAQLDNIFFDDIEANAVATITVSDNVIDAGNVDPLVAGGDGIEFDMFENNANATITVTNNQISNVAFEGIEFGDIEDDAIATITVENNQITSNETGIEFDAIENRANATIIVTGNTITVANEESILFDDIENDTVSNITVAENNILSAATEGIEFDVIEDNANATINILNNQISNVGEEGIFFNDIQENTTAAITVTGNSITNAGDNGIELTLIENNANVTATVTDNTITNPGANGVRIEHVADTDFCLALDNNSVTTPGDDGFELISNGAGQFQVLDRGNVTARNIGTFDPADVETNAAFVEGTEGVAPCP